MRWRTTNALWCSGSLHLGRGKSWFLDLPSQSWINKFLMHDALSQSQKDSVSFSTVWRLWLGCYRCSLWDSCSHRYWQGSVFSLLPEHHLCTCFSPSHNPMFLSYRLELCQTIHCQHYFQKTKTDFVAAYKTLPQLAIWTKSSFSQDSSLFFLDHFFFYLIYSLVFFFWELITLSVWPRALSMSIALKELKKRRKNINYYFDSFISNDKFDFNQN